jgi:hypothetical protein
MTAAAIMRIAYGHDGAPAISTCPIMCSLTMHLHVCYCSRERG